MTTAFIIMLMALAVGTFMLWYSINKNKPGFDDWDQWTEADWDE